MRHAQRRGRRREEELPVAVAAGRRRGEHGRFVEEDSERPLAADDARRVHAQRAGDEPGGQALFRPRGVLRPLSKAERPFATISTLTSGPGRDLVPGATSAAKRSSSMSTAAPDA